MRMRLLDVLLCPKCRAHPLKLVATTKERKEILQTPEKVLCEKYCAYRGGGPSAAVPKDCAECMSIDVLAGELICEKCGARYGIYEGVPCF